jgi:hypothetical protein
MSSNIWKAIRDSSEYVIKLGDEFEEEFPEYEGDLLTNRAQPHHEFGITQEVLEVLGKPLRLG